MVILFEDIEKKAKTALLKGLEDINQIIKNLYSEVYINSEGVCYNNESLIENGRVVCKTNINELINIEQAQLFKLKPRTLYECISNGKTKIIGYTIENDTFTFNTTEGEYIIGEFINNECLNLNQVNDITANITVSQDMSHIINDFIDKKLVEADIKGYSLILTHKLFPNIHKCTSLNVDIVDNNDGTFYACFNTVIEDKNKSGKVTLFLEMTFIYKFLII